ncbi:hypothetical protein ACOMHN_007250 [Nucella lapillus]
MVTPMTCTPENADRLRKFMWPVVIAALQATLQDTEQDSLPGWRKPAEDVYPRSVTHTGAKPDTLSMTPDGPTSTGHSTADGVTMPPDGASRCNPYSAPQQSPWMQTGSGTG